MLTRNDASVAEGACDWRGRSIALRIAVLRPRRSYVTLQPVKFHEILLFREALFPKQMQKTIKIESFLVNIMLKFTPISNHTPGTLYNLLARSYHELLLSDQDYWTVEKEGWLQFDREVFENPNTIGNCVFVSMEESNPVGFGSFDPSQAPEVGIIGHNVILPEFRGRGIGKMQIEEILRRFRTRGIQTAMVSTNDHPFFLPAQRMYLACGFRETRRLSGGPDLRYQLIEYQRDLR